VARIDGVQPIGACADGFHVELGLAEFVGRHPAEDVYRQDSQSRIVEERGIWLAQGEPHRIVVDPFHDHRAPQVGDLGFSWELGLLDGADRVDHVIGVERCTVLPDYVVPQVKRV